jgi:hypothetical protein
MRYFSGDSGLYEDVAEVPQKRIRKRRLWRSCGNRIMFCYGVDALFMLNEWVMPLLNGHFATGDLRIEANQISSFRSGAPIA